MHSNLGNKLPSESYFYIFLDHDSPAMSVEEKKIRPNPLSKNYVPKLGPQLMYKVDLLFYYTSGKVNSIAQVDGTDAILTVSTDQSIRVWILRESSGKYFPSVCHYMKRGVGTYLHYNHDHKKVFVGMDNGTISEFTLSKDLDGLEHVKDYDAHKNMVTGLYYSSEKQWLLSCSKDKQFQHHSAKTGLRWGGYQCKSSCAAIAYDDKHRYVFIGDNVSDVMVCKLDEQHGVLLVDTIKGHNRLPIQWLHWNGHKSVLQTCSSNGCISTWIINSPQQQTNERIYRLMGHKQKALYCQLDSSSEQLLSIADDGEVLVWDMEKERMERPAWLESDNCQLCNRPFFWNIPDMYEQTQFGVRQHHCRKCGKAVCDNCSPKRTILPKFGYEIEVRICKECNVKIEEEGATPYVKKFDMKQNISCLSYDSESHILITIGADQVMRIWDMKPIF